MNRRFARLLFRFIPFVSIVVTTFTLSSFAQVGTAAVERVQRDSHTPATAGSIFLPVVNYDSGGIGANAIAVADVNGDGKLDLIVANCEAHGLPASCVNNGNVVDGIVAVLLGNGDGTFAPPMTYDSGGENATSVAVGDVNGDGKPDLVVANCAPTGTTTCTNGGVVSVLLGNGDGTFQTAVVYSSGGISADSVKLADLIGDGKLDIVVASVFNTVQNSTSGLLGVLLGNGDGTFQSVVTYPSGEVDADSVAVADVNGDHKPDLIVSNGACPNTDDAHCVGVLLGNGDGTFQPVITYKSGGGEGTSIAVADVNGDGKPDVLITNLCIFCANTVGVLLGNGDGTFQAPATYGTGSYDATSVAVADVDGDGHPDLIVANQCSGSLAKCKEESGVIGVLLNKGDGTFKRATTYDPGGDSTSFVVAADLNGDGMPDVLVVNNSQDTDNGSIGVLLNNTKSSATGITLASSLNPSNLGQSVEFKASVKSSTGIPTGTVIFYDGSTSLGGATLSNGMAALSTSSLSSGAHSITASYQGSGSFNPSTSSVLDQVVNATVTNTTLVSSLNPSNFGQTVLFTAAVTSSSGTPTGAVLFYDGSTVLATVALSNGIAGFSTSLLPAGSNSITAVYSGSSNFAPSSSAPLIQTVTRKSKFVTHLRLSTSMSPVYVGQLVTLSAFVESGGGTIPDGEVVDFYHAGFIGSAPIQGGRATLTTGLSYGYFLDDAIYPGDANLEQSGSRASQVVLRWPTSTTLVSSLNPVVYGQPITYTATVTSSGPNPPTGFVRFTEIGKVPLVNGVATATQNQVRVGTHAITAEYLEDAASAKSRSAVIEEVSQPAPTTASIVSSVNPSASGQAVTFTATVTSSTGVTTYGKVTFTAGTATLGTATLKNNVASVSTSSLPAGSTKITVTYGGTPSFVGSSASLTQKVNP